MANLIIREGGVATSHEVAQGIQLLDALRAANVTIDAPCGGNGTCGKCRVMVHDEEGVGYKLACEAPVTDGMEVVVEQARPMEVSTSGASCSWSADGEPGEYGVAIDVGTTTVVCRLVDLSSGEVVATYGRSNPQITFGADVISRITACDAGHLGEMNTLLRDALSSMISLGCAKASIEPSRISRIVLAANTTMEHIAAGIDPSPIGVMPFTPPTLFGYEVDLIEGMVPAHFAKCAAGYVGGDVVAGLLSVGMLESDKPMILLDLGTNGEMALGDKNGIVTCATAAGPVFEGANIRFGMPAYPGAISRVGFEDGELKLTVIGDEDPVGICGTGLIDAVALMLEQGVVDGSGLLLDDDEVPEHMARFIDELDGENVFRLSESVCVTQKDIRCLQLAKSAVCAGIYTMLDDRGVDIDEVDALLIAGGFGEYLNLSNAARVGLFPAELLPCAKSVGNTAIEGATAMLVSSEARSHLDDVVAASSYLELSLHSGFNTYYVETMMFEE